MPSVVGRNGFVIGVDVGGTKVAAGLVDGEGNIQSQARGAMISQHCSVSSPSA